MEIGEATHGTEGPIDTESTATVSVPDGEVWKFTVVALSTEEGDYGRNDDLTVGVDDGENTVAVASSNFRKSPAVGGYGGSTDTGQAPSGVRSMIVDGSEANLFIQNNDPGSKRRGYWAATRVS